jgi:hypothetical protein
MFDRIGKRAIRELSPGAGVPRRPGLYYMNPIPKIDDKAMIETFWKIWEHGRTGLYFDEVLNVPDDPSFESLCVQGRSKHIQMIMCNQRPYDLSTYVLTQSDFVAAFPVQRVEDQRCLESYLGRPGIMRERRPKRHALWLDVEEAELMELTPRPPPDHILGRINDRAPRALWWR